MIYSYKLIDSVTVVAMDSIGMKHESKVLSVVTHFTGDIHMYFICMCSTIIFPE